MTPKLVAPVTAAHRIRGTNWHSLVQIRRSTHHRWAFVAWLSV